MESDNDAVKPIRVMLICHKWPADGVVQYPQGSSITTFIDYPFADKPDDLWKRTIYCWKK